MTPMLAAVQRRRLDVIRLLAAAGADPNARCPKAGSTPLHRRAGTCMSGAMAALLNAGADPAARDVLDRTPLHHVTLGHRRGDVGMAVGLLLGAGADPEARDANGETVRELAASRRDAVALWALTDAGIGGAP